MGSQRMEQLFFGNIGLIEVADQAKKHSGTGQAIVDSLLALKDLQGG